MTTHPDVLILGGGVIGLSTAWYLAQEGVRVTVVEKDDIGRQASWAGAGILPPTDLRLARSPIELLRAHSGLLYPDLSAQLRAATGIDNGFIVCGGIELPVDDAHELPTEEWHQDGIAFERLTRDGLHHHAPELSSRYTHGVWLPGVAQVRNPWHLRALQAGCVKCGVMLQPHWPVERLVVERQRVIAVEGSAGRLSAGHFLITAGAWSSQLLKQVNGSPDIRPIRGQIALFHTGKAGMRPILMQGKRYLVPRTDGRVLAGSTEEEVGFEAQPTGGGIAELLAFAFDLVPSLAEAVLEKTWAGLRPGSPDGWPYLGNVPGVENLHVAAGHFRAGLQLSPATGRVMAQHILGQATLVPLEAFRLER
jgi:glycine oxidase